MAPRCLLLICLLGFALNNPAFAAETVQEVRFEGLQKTRSHFLMQFLQTRPGAVLDSAAIEDDLRRLRNLQLFSSVGYATKSTQEGHEVTFIVREVATLLPIANFGGIRENFWFQLGAVDHNFLGRRIRLSGFYRFYDRHSFETALHAPWLFKNRIGITSYLNKLSTLEPAYIGGVTAQYFVDRWAGHLLLQRHMGEHLQWQAGVGFFRERYQKDLEQSGENSPGPISAEFDKFALQAGLHWTHLNYFGLLRDGFDHHLAYETVRSDGDADVFHKFMLNSRLFQSTGNKVNFAFRLRGGISSNTDSPFQPFVLDSYVTVRGAGNRVARGTAELTANGEVRVTVLPKDWGGFQAVVFADWSAWRPGGRNFDAMFDSENTVTFAGIGLRVYIQNLNNLIIRLDYGESLQGSRGNGIVIGTGQYF